MPSPLPALAEEEPLSAARRERILTGAAAVFTAQGYEGAAMSRIAAQAGVSKGTLYNYYANKRDLFAAVIRDRCALLLDQTFGELPPAGEAQDGLTRIGRVMLRMMLSPQGLAMFRLVVMEAAKFPDLATIYTQAGPDVVIGRMRLWLDAQVAAGHLAIADTAFAAEQFFALTQTRLLQRARLQPGFAPGDDDIAEVVSRAATMFIAAYGPGGGSAV